MGPGRVLLPGGVQVRAKTRGRSQDDFCHRHFTRRSLQSVSHDGSVFGFGAKRCKRRRRFMADTAEPWAHRIGGVGCGSEPRDAVVTCLLLCARDCHFPQWSGPHPSARCMTRHVATGRGRAPSVTQFGTQATGRKSAGAVGTPPSITLTFSQTGRPEDDR